MEAKPVAELFDGVLTWFARVNTYASALGLTPEHYIISSDLKEIIEGTPAVVTLRVKPLRLKHTQMHTQNKIQWQIFGLPLNFVLNRSNAPALLAKSRAYERLQTTQGALAPQDFSGRLQLPLKS